MTKREIKIRVLELVSSQVARICKGDYYFWIEGTKQQQERHEAKVAEVIDDFVWQLDGQAEKLRETENRRIARRGL